METSKFNFSEFLISKGFKKTNYNIFKYIDEDNYELTLAIRNDEYIMPFTADKRFRSEIPKTEEKAISSFNTIEEIVGIKFTNQNT